MLAFILALINLLLEKGGTIEQVLAAGKANGLTAGQLQDITDGYAEMEERRERDAAGDTPA